MMVRSADQLVSKTLSKPRRRRALTIWPVAMSPGLPPKGSLMATRTEGAVCTMTIFSGSRRACQARSVSLFMVMAPVGQTLRH